MELLNPIRMELNEDSLRQILLYCSNLNEYKAIIVFNNIKDLTKCAYNIPDYCLAGISKVSFNNKNEIYVLFDNGSRLYFMLNEGHPCFHRVHALLFNKEINIKILNTVFDPMLTPYLKQ